MIHDKNENKSEEKMLTTIEQEYKILAEYKMIESEKPPGVYVIPSYENSLLWFGVIFVRSGYYTDGVFRFNISLPDKFPEDKNPPTIIFQNDIFHPLICPYTSTLDLSQAFSKWRTGEDHIWQILKYIIAIFFEPWEQIRTDEKNLNQIAANLIVQNRNEFIEKAKGSVIASKERIYDPPPTDDQHYICFQQYQQDIHENVLEKMKSGIDLQLKITPPNSGLSWVKEGEFKPLSKE